MAESILRTAPWIRPIRNALKPIRDLSRRTFTGRCVEEYLSEVECGKRLKRGDLDTDSGTLHSTMQVADSVTYVEHLVETYMRLGRKTSLSGSVVELGVGDNLGSLILLESLGASRAVAVDRYKPRSGIDSQLPVYEALADRHNLDLASLAKRTGHFGVEEEYGTPAERYFDEHPDQFEAILSWSVMEHLYDPIGALHSMVAGLEPGGFMVHSIDLRDHEKFGETKHPLQFLTIPSKIYPHLVINSGGPNRVLAHRYREWLAASDVDGEILIHGLVGTDENMGGKPWDELPRLERDNAVAIVRANRRHFAREFRDVSDEDLAISGIQLVVRK